MSQGVSHPPGVSAPMSGHDDVAEVSPRQDAPVGADRGPDGRDRSTPRGPNDPDDPNGVGDLVHWPAAVVVFAGGRAPFAASIVHRWVRSGVAPGTVDALIDAVAPRVAQVPKAGPLVVPELPGWRIWVQPTVPGSTEPGGGAVVVARDDIGEWTRQDLAAIVAFAAMWGKGWERSTGYVDLVYQRSLDALVVDVAEHLVSANSATLRATLTWAVRTLAEFLQADAAFLRRNDLAAGTSVLVAEHPAREDVPDPDPLGVVPFDADPLFAALRDLTEPVVTTASTAPQEYEDRVAAATGIPGVSGAAVPLLHGETTWGCLGFARFGERQWTVPEVNALSAVAALVMQLILRVDAEEQLRYAALHDDLTGLFNRRALLDELGRRLEATAGTTTLLFLDLDRFKVMNDSLGHAAGDTVLVTIADRVQTSLRPGDFAARFGGDEFVVLLGAGGSDLDAVATARRMLDLVSQPIVLQGQSVTHTASVGVARGNRGEVGSLELLGRGDAALYTAKARGRNEIVVFDDDMRALVDTKATTELWLRDAIAQDGLRLFYQPEFDLTDGRLLALEALVRWEHPTRGLLPASEFVPLAEEAGLIVGLGMWVLEEVCRQMARWSQRFPDLDILVRVNMSPRELAMPDTVGNVARCLRLAGVRPPHLCVELTEHAIVADIDRLVTALDGLRSLGVTLAIDDFGTGHSSMAQLKRLPVDVLKIDQSFVTGLADDPVDQAIVKAIIGLGRALDLEVVAEGVESSAELDALRAIGCLRAQGFLLGEPEPEEGLDALLSRGRIALAAPSGSETG